MRSRQLVGTVSVAALVLTGCAKVRAQPETVEKAATVVPVGGSGAVRVRLSPEAVKRLDVQTGTVRDAPVAARPTASVVGVANAPPATAVRRVIPFSAVMYAPTGDAFAYVSAGPQLYERAPIAVDYVTSDLAVLSAGPPAGTSIVTVGGPELSGIELGTGE